MPVLAGEIAVELCPVQVAQVVDPAVEVFHHGVDVVHVQALESFRARHVSVCSTHLTLPLLARWLSELPRRLYPGGEPGPVLDGVDRSSGVGSGGHPVRHRRRVVRVGHGADRSNRPWSRR